MNARSRILFVFVAALLVLGALRIFSTPRAVNAAEEEAVIATIKLNSGDMGSAEERQRITALEDQLSGAIKRSATGEFDGDEYGGGVCIVYMYGPSAERLFAAVSPILKKFRAPKGSYVVKRYGKPGARQDRIALSDE